MDLQKVREALVEIANQEVGTWDNPVPFSVLYRRSVDIAREALAALDAEKPAEENYMVLLDAIFDAIKENGITNHPTKGMFLTGESIDACLPIIQQYAEAYHARKLVELEKPAEVISTRIDNAIRRAEEEESAAILAASDRLGAALDESDKVR